MVDQPPWGYYYAGIFWTWRLTPPLKKNGVSQNSKCKTPSTSSKRWARGHGAMAFVPYRRCWKARWHARHQDGWTSTEDPLEWWPRLSFTALWWSSSWTAPTTRAFGSKRGSVYAIAASWPSPAAAVSMASLPNPPPRPPSAPPKSISRCYCVASITRVSGLRLLWTSRKPPTLSSAPCLSLRHCRPLSVK